MGLDFKIRDFAYPLALVRLKRQFDRHQWLSEEALARYQRERLRRIIEHAYRHVPYYQKVFKKHAIVPDDIKAPADLKAIPFLTKDALRDNFSSLIADNAKRYKPMVQTTSGTTGGLVRFYVDKPSNILEFVYYWRFWGWAGYRIGETFAELSAQFFTPYEEKAKTFCHFEYLTRRLMVNSLLLSGRHGEEYIRIFKRFKPLFLKGLASNLYMLALILNERKNHGISLKGVFSQGENLLQFQRELIEKVFSCKVFDSYGHMERTVVISQCPVGTYHVHADYGIAEFVETELSSITEAVPGEQVREVVGTSLHNLAMPLLRYRTGDLVRIKSAPPPCPCGRGFPTVISILGRSSDVIITPDRRAITALYLALDRTPGIILGQIIQERIDRLLVKVACNTQDMGDIDSVLLRNLRDFVGSAMDIQIVHAKVEDIKQDRAGKFKVIISRIPQEEILG